MWKSAKIRWTFCSDRHIKDCPPMLHEGGRIMCIKVSAAFATTLLLVALALNVSSGAAQSGMADRQSGTWKMDPAKSKYSPGPAPKSVTLKIVSDADNIKLTSDGIDAAGNPTHVEFTAKYDGKDYPITGVPNGDTIAVSRIDENTVESSVKKGGEVVMTVRSVVSKDGKTRTQTFRGKDAQGKEVNNVVVYRKT